MISTIVAASMLLSASKENTEIRSCPVATESAIRAEYSHWLTAYRAKDISGTMAIFDPGIRFQFQGAPDQGFQDLKSGYLNEFSSRSTVTWEPVWDQILVSGKMAAAFATWRGLLAQESAERRVIAENRSTDIFVRGSDCRWRIVRSLNYPTNIDKPKATSAPAS